MNYDALLKLMNEMSKSVKPDDKLEKIIDEYGELSEDELDLVAGGIIIPDVKVFEHE